MQSSGDPGSAGREPGEPMGREGKIFEMKQVLSLSVPFVCKSEHEIGEKWTPQ